MIHDIFKSLKPSGEVCILKVRSCQKDWIAGIFLAPRLLLVNRNRSAVKIVAQKPKVSLKKKNNCLPTHLNLEFTPWRWNDKNKHASNWPRNSNVCSFRTDWARLKTVPIKTTETFQAIIFNKTPESIHSLLHMQWISLTFIHLELNLS